MSRRRSNSFPGKASRRRARRAGLKEIAVVLIPTVLGFVALYVGLKAIAAPAPAPTPAPAVNGHYT
jgi:hypothetical protein